MTFSEEIHNQMLRSVRLQNYKCFEDQLLEFKSLTLLTGLNGTGKSSVIQALLLLRQSFQQNLLQTTGLALNGDLIYIGNAKDALFENRKGEMEMIGFQLLLGNGSTGTWHFDDKIETDNKYIKGTDVLRLVPDVTTNLEEIYKSCVFGNNFHYLQAERIGPRRFFETSDFLVKQRRQLGSAGEYTAQFLDVFRNQIIFNEGLSHPDAVSLT